MEREASRAPAETPEDSSSRREEAQSRSGWLSRSVVSQRSKFGSQEPAEGRRQVKGKCLQKGPLATKD